MNEGHIFINGQITRETLADVNQQLRNTSASTSLVLHIASPGGSVYAGYNIYHALKNSGKPISVIVEGEAQSMASFLTMLGPSKICNPSRFMIHNPRSGVEGTADEMIQGANELIKIEDEMAQVYSQKTGIPIDKIKEMMSKETYLTAQEAKTLGFVDEVVGEYYLKAVAMGKEHPAKKQEPVAKKLYTEEEVMELVDQLLKS